VQFSTVHKIKYLHHDKCVEDKSKVSRVYMEFLEYRIVVVITIDIKISTWSYGSADYSTI